MREAMVKVRVARTIQEKPYHPWSVEVELEEAIPTSSARISTVKSLINEANMLVDKAVTERMKG